MSGFWQYFANPFRCLTVAGIILIVVLIRAHWVTPKPRVQAPPAAGSVAGQPANPLPANEPLPAGLPALTATNNPTAANALFAATMDEIHEKLRQWAATKTGDRGTQDRLQNELLALLTDENAAQILHALSPEELDGPFGLAAITHWMNVDPVAAAQWVAALPGATEDQAWVVAHNLTASGLDVKSFADAMPDTPWKQTFLTEAGLAILSTDPQEAVRLAQRITPGGAQTSLFQTVAADWISREPNQALDWILSIHDPALQEQLVAAGAKSYALTDPALAANWLVSAVKSEAVLDNNLPSLVAIWSAKDPAAAANWVSQFPEGSLKAAALTTVANQWQQSDPGAASEWLSSLPALATGGHRAQ